jgi:hypothetical protein
LNAPNILIGRYEGKLIQTMCKHFNFTYELIICNNDWGTQMPFKTWTGIIGKIVSEVYSEVYLFFCTEISISFQIIDWFSVKNRFLNRKLIITFIESRLWFWSAFNNITVRSRPFLKLSYYNFCFIPKKV